MNINIRRVEFADKLSVNVEFYVDYDNKKFYKVYKDTTDLDLVERNIRFLYEHQVGSPKILELLYDDGHFVGYVQEYIADSKTFFEGEDDKDITFEKKYKYIMDIFQELRRVHQYGAFVGDIHSKNLLYNDDGGYLIDLDDIRFSKEDNQPLTEYYYIHRTINDDYDETSKNTDNIKATIAALSLLYGFDFEDVVIRNSLSTLMYYLELFIGDKDLLNDIGQIFYNRDDDSIIYFDDVLRKYFSGKILIKEDLND